MSKSAPTPLTLPAIPKKGQAAPVVQSIETPPASQATAAPPPSSFAPSARSLPPPPVRASSRVRATIAVTLRLDEERYEQLKSYGSRYRLTNQDILVAALDRFMQENG